MSNGFNSGCSTSTSPLEQLGISLNSQSGLNLGLDMGQSSSSQNNAAANMLAALTQTNRKCLLIRLKCIRSLVINDVLQLCTTSRFYLSNQEVLLRAAIKKVSGVSCWFVFNV